MPPVLGQIEAVLLAQELDLARIDLLARGQQLGDVALEVVARRQLDQGEDQHADQQQGRDHVEHALQHVAGQATAGQRGEHSARAGRCRHRASTK
jgi:hypothetical protein